MGRSAWRSKFAAIAIFVRLMRARLKSGNAHFFASLGLMLGLVFIAGAIFALGLNN